MPEHPPAPGARPRCLIAGATGLVGRELLRLLNSPQAPLLLLTRRPLPVPLQAGLGPACEVLQRDSLRQPGPLPALDMGFIALGSTLAQAGSQAAFRAIDLDTVLAVARAARDAGARRLAVVSALGADPGSRLFYNRVKGEMEAGLHKLGFERLVIARPSLLDGDRAALGQPPRGAEARALRLLRPVLRLLPARLRPIDAAVVARAMVHALLDEGGPALRILDSAALARSGGRSLPPRP